MRVLVFGLLLVGGLAQADTINNYMNIANNIPQMEIKADPQAQAWARSAHHVLNITCESIAETMSQANDIAKNKGKPIFCLPPGVRLNASMLDQLIQQAYKDLSSQPSDKDTMTVSQVAWMAVSKQYPCEQNTAYNNEMARIQSVYSK